MFEADPGGGPELQRSPSQQYKQDLPEAIKMPPSTHSVLGVAASKLVELHRSIAQPLLQVVVGIDNPTTRADNRRTDVMEIKQTLFSNWPRHLNLFEKARFLENP